MDLAFINLLRLICHKTQQTKLNQTNILVRNLSSAPSVNILTIQCIHLIVLYDGTTVFAKLMDFYSGLGVRDLLIGICAFVFSQLGPATWKYLFINFNGMSLIILFYKLGNCVYCTF